VPQLKHIAYHGSLLLQTLLQFKNPRLVFQSLLAIPASHSIALACHVSGSHVIDAFITSECVKSRTKKQWIELMKVNFICTFLKFVYVRLVYADDSCSLRHRLSF